MNALALDIWAELRAKRLVPVAAAMLIALVAIPVFLIKSPERVSAPTPASSASSKQLQPIDSRALARTADQSVSDGSALNAFLAKNPFKPVKDLSGESLAGGATNPFGSPAAAGGGEVVAAGGEGEGGGGVDESGLGGTTGGGGGGGTTEPSQPESQGESRKYTYVIDLTFRENGKAKEHKSLERLSMLPSESKPLLVFLGVTASGNEASFLVDATLTTTGEGRCKPSASNCGFVYLQPGQVQQFADVQGTTYELQVDQIRRVTLKAAANAAAARTRRARAAEESRPVARTAEGPAPERRRLRLPLLSDFEIEFGGQE